MDRAQAASERKRETILSDKFFSPKMIENRADALLSQYVRQSGRQIDFPIPVDRIAEYYLDLKLLWEPIPEEGRGILAKLQPFKKTVVFNETHLAWIDGIQGLERTILAHEIGHWDLHFDKTLLNQPALPGFTQPTSYAVYRDETKTNQDRQAHSFMGYFLMPSSLLIPAIRQVNLLNWHDLYGLRELLQVTITALTVRLQGMGLLYVDPSSQLYESKGVHDGQMRL